VEITSTAFILIRHGYSEASIALWVRLNSPPNVIASPFGFAQAKLREAISSILVRRLPRRPDGLLAMTSAGRVQH